MIALKNYCFHTLQEILPIIEESTLMRIRVCPFTNKPFSTSLRIIVSPSQQNHTTHRIFNSTEQTGGSVGASSCGEGGSFPQLQKSIN